MAETWQDITGSTVLQKGDVLRVWAKVVGANTYLKAAQMDKAIRDIEKKDPRFRVEGYSALPDEDGAFFVKVRIVDPAPQKQLAGHLVAGVVGGIVLSALLVSVGFVAAGRLQRRSQGVVESVGDTVEDATLNLVKWAAMAVVGYIAVKSVTRN